MHMILVLLIWQSADWINIEGGEERMGKVQQQFPFFLPYETINGVVILKCNIK